MTDEMTRENVLMNEFDDDEMNREAIDDLKRVEEEARQEAEISVEAEDDGGNEQEAAEAAATAFQFQQAEIATEQINESRARE